MLNDFFRVFSISKITKNKGFFLCAMSIEKQPGLTYSYITKRFVIQTSEERSHMTNNELLLAISNIVQTHTDPIKQNVQDMGTHLENEIKQAKAHLENEIQFIKDDISALKNDVSSLNSDVSTLKSDVSSLKSDVSILKSDVATLKKDQKHTQLLLENEVLPRLQNLESCYTTTYERYASGIQQLDALQCDVDILKNVVAEHSEILQRIS